MRNRRTARMATPTHRPGSTSCGRGTQPGTPPTRSSSPRGSSSPQAPLSPSPSEPMRATSTVLLLLALTACRISGLGNCSTDADCSAGAACDLAQRVCVPTDAPAFSDIAVSTPAGYTDPNGRAFFDTAGPPLSVSASVSGRAGVDPATVCLRIAGGSGACLHPGTAGSGTTFTFALPMSSGCFNGTAPLDFTIAATSPTGRSSTSAVQHVYFDNQPPAIAVAGDPAH